MGMANGYAFLEALATVLCVAAATTVLFQWLRLPVVLGYVASGMVVGPHIPFPLVADPAVVAPLSELGVTLLMFSLGLEFSLRKLLRIGPTAGLIMIIEVSTMLGLGYLVGRLLGFSPIESIFAGAMVSISSTMIIAKSLGTIFSKNDSGSPSGQHPEHGYVELLFGVLVAEDLMAILLLAALTALSAGSLSAGTLLGTAGRLLAFLSALLTAGLLLIPRLVRAVARLGSAETLLVLCIGLCSAVALLAHAAGYSVALGSFVCGSLVAESGEGKHIEPLLHPLRDLFGAVFFVSVGMSIDPRILVHHYREIAALLAVVIGGKLTGVALGALLTGHTLRISIQAAMSLAQIGEFSFILAGFGVAQGATRDFLYPVAVGVSAVTALLTPGFMRAAPWVATYADRFLPRPLQQFMSLYAAWVERLRTQRPSGRSVARRLALHLFLDDLCLLGLYIGAALSAPRVQTLAATQAGLVPWVSGAALATVAAILSIPFWIGLVRTARRLAQLLAARVISPPRQEQADLGAAPRRTLAVSLNILVLLTAGAPLIAVTAPFVPALPWLLGVVVWAVLVSVLGLSFWRSATNLLGHVRAGAQAIVELLAAQSHSPADAPDQLGTPPLPEGLLAGLGIFTAYTIGPQDPCVQKSLARLNLRGLTGATVLAIKRHPGSVAAPHGQEVLKAGDVVILVGTSAAVSSAQNLLRGEPLPNPEDRDKLFAGLDA